MVLHGLEGRTGRDFQEGAKEGERWESKVSSIPGMRGRDLTRSRGGARCAPGKNGGFPLTILKPRAEGYETKIVANLAFRGPVNRVTCMRKPQALNALTVWVFASDETRARRLTAAKLHGTSPRGEQSSTEAVAEVQMDDRKR